MKKRQAVVGWLVYKAAKPIAKRTMKRKAKAAVPARRSGSRWMPNTAAIVAALSAVGGALLFWRKKKSGGDEPSPEG
jgi:LPXTG-motif cell wall-anchored protein